jgi:hypothetical protein
VESYKYLLNIVIREQLDYGVVDSLKDSMNKLFNDPKGSLGLAQIEVRRAAELYEPDRNWDETPLTASEINKYEKMLENPEKNIKILAMELTDNYNYYGRVEGKTDADRWLFAIAKHKSGHQSIGEAQVESRDAELDLNKWSDVSKYLSPDITDFVDFVSDISPLPPGTFLA